MFDWDRDEKKTKPVALDKNEIEYEEQSKLSALL